MRTSTALATGLGLSLVMVSGGVGAQTVAGSVEDGGRWLLSLHQGGERVGDPVVSGPDGTFRLDAPDVGRYELVAERAGRETVRSGSFELEDGSTHEVVLASGDPLEGVLTGIEGSLQGGCVVRPDPGSEAGRVWDRARIALEVAATLARDGGLRLDASVHARELGPDGRTVRRESATELHESVPRVSPLLDATDLVERGFVREDADGGYRFFTPTPGVLTSAAFLDTHCLRVRPDGGPALVGLAFEPAPDRDASLPDVAGVLWLRASDGSPILMEYTFRNFDLGISLGGSGGTVLFAELPDGSWVTPETTLRMPLLEVELGPDGEPGDRWALAGVREERIRLLRARSGDGAWGLATETGALEGVVRLHDDGEVLEGARVSIPGTPWETLTDGEGRFRMEGLLTGVYGVTASHPRLERLPMGVEARNVFVEEGGSSDVELFAPRPEEAAERLCGPADQERVILSGQVLDSLTAEPIAGIPLTVRFRDPRRSGAPHHEARVTSGTGGEFVYCDLPPLTEVRVRGLTPGNDGTGDRVFMTGSAGVIRKEVQVGLSTVQEPNGVFGMIREYESQRGVQGAVIELAELGLRAVSNTQGFFALPEVPPGLHVVTVSSLGYTDRETVVNVGGAGAVRLDIDLAAEAIPIEGITVAVVPKRMFGDMVDMQRRIEMGFGTFIMRDELERRGGTLASALRGRAGVNIISDIERLGGEYAVLRGATDLDDDGIRYCFPAVYMDGQRWSQPRAGGMGHEPVDLSVFPVGSLEAVEVYRGSAVPGEFGGGDAPCGSIVVWTRRGGAVVRGSATGGGGEG